MVADDGAGPRGEVLDRRKNLPETRPLARPAPRALVAGAADCLFGNG